MIFKCINTNAGKCPAHEREWMGRVEISARTGHTAELFIEGRGSCMDAVVGKYQTGLYICIPDIDVGCPISSMPDYFWNRERLSKHMNQTDAITVAWALKAAASHWGLFPDV